MSELETTVSKCPNCGEHGLVVDSEDIPARVDHHVFRVCAGSWGVTLHGVAGDRKKIDSDDIGLRHNWQKAKKKPVVVEFRGPYRDTDTIETIEGDFEIDEEYLEEHGAYVLIRGVEGEVYPCALDIFRETYELVREDR